MLKKADLLGTSTDLEIRQRSTIDRLLDLPKTTRRRVLAPIIKKEKIRMQRENWADSVDDEIGRHVGVKMHQHGAVLLEIPCEEGHVVEWTSPNRIPPQMVAKKLKQLGWRVGQHVRCPEHNRKTNDNHVQKELKVMTDTTTATLASDKARTAKRLAMMELEDSFNVEKGCFKAGVSDASIAKELGVSETVVSRLREEFYGPLKVPDGIEEVAKAAEQLRVDFDQKLHTLSTEHDGKLAKLHSRLDALINKNKWIE